VLEIIILKPMEDMEKMELVISNQRRITNKLKLINCSQNSMQILCADSLYGGSLMDGKLKVITLTSSNNTYSYSLNHFIETSSGISAFEEFKFVDEDGKDVSFVVLGCEDGSIHVYDLSKYIVMGNYTNTIFKVKKTSTDQSSSIHVIDRPDERFSESLKVHSGSVKSIIANPGDPTKFASVGVDGVIFIWYFCNAKKLENGRV
jgi:WD40 repeat protein